ncbi:hypothetical protein [Chthonobacter albigriseus]|uniref:hypothetical protein n=1 Tax=Chthonobacter albigriseus TaxID=1683161 RepID=UPI0015EE7D1C|nr:hypothetical protein [Chthonobacter albigriseus]
MAYDVPGARPWYPGEDPVFVSVPGDDAGTLKGYWDKLSEGGTVIRPIGPAGFSPLYGMLKDGFGVTWVLDLHFAHPAT